MIAALSLALALAGVNEMFASPPCWIRDGSEALDIRVSRLDSVITTLGTDTLVVCYSRPRMLGRPIMGRVVPFAEPWRLGANEATTLTVSVPVLFGEIRIPPGTYSLYAIPEQSKWRVVVNRAGRRWGIPINDTVRTQDIGSVSVAVEAVAPPVEEFSMEFERDGNDAVDLVIEWDRTRVRVPIRRVPT